MLEYRFVTDIKHFALHCLLVYLCCVGHWRILLRQILSGGCLFISQTIVITVLLFALYKRSRKAFERGIKTSLWPYNVHIMVFSTSLGQKCWPTLFEPFQ